MSGGLKKKYGKTLRIFFKPLLMYDTLVIITGSQNTGK